MPEQLLKEYVLGIDLGSNSLGWAIVELDDGKPAGLFNSLNLPALGARIFDAATEGDRASGQEQTRNVARREARHARRQALRRARRIRSIFRLLQDFDLLPKRTDSSQAGLEGWSADAEVVFREKLGTLNRRRPPNSSEGQQQNFLNALDGTIATSEWFRAKSPSYSPEKKICAGCEELRQGQRGANGAREKCCAACDRLRQVLPYLLRASALYEPLPPYLLGRALYHLGQRRGFRSNRRGGGKRGEDVGKVKRGISKLEQDMQKAGASTLGEYLSRLSPTERRIRGPERWTGRHMYEDEFDAIWEEQKKYHPDLLTEGCKKALRHTFYDQRPVWFDPNTIGRCELEPDQRRAPMYLLISQRFRLLQQVNNLRILPPGEPEYDLTKADRQKLIDALELRGDLSFDQVRKLLGLEKGYKFNLEPQKRKRKKGAEEAGGDNSDDEKSGSAKLKGNRTNAAFYKVFGEPWLEKMTSQDRTQAVDYVYAFGNPAALAVAAKTKWFLSDEAAKALSKISFETRPAGLSLTAMGKLLPLLEAGKTYAEARRETYPEKFAASAPLRELPPVDFAADPEKFRKHGQYQKWLGKTHALPTGASLPEALGEIRNPAVTRSLTELRKVINDLVRRLGKPPAEIHIELLRELKNPKRVRERMAEANSENRAARNRAKAEVKEALGEAYEPSDEDIVKVLLAKECGEQCVYCGQPLARANFYGEGTDVHIDHIIPRSVFPDSTFANLVLCHSRCNLEKGDRTPYQAFSGERYEEVIAQAKKLQGKVARRKLRRFTMNNEELEKFHDKFSERQLRDSAYAAKLAAKYLGYLYGGVTDATGRLRVICTSGEATAQLRKAWGLYAVLNDGPTSQGGATKKPRNDHRHHAVDAIAIALTGPGTVQDLSNAFKKMPPGSKRRTPPMESPWNNFVDSVRAEIDKIVVSHRVSKKVSGALHEETIYSRPIPVGAGLKPAPTSANPGGGDTAATEVRVRKPLASLTKPEIEKIADESVKKLVMEKMEKLGGGEPGKLFSKPENLPRFLSSGVVIKNVRISKAEKPTVLGQGRTQRHVISGNNHHIEIYAELDRDGNEKEWGGEVVSMLEAFQRLKTGKPVVQRDHGPLVKFKFSLAKGDTVEIQGEDKQKALFVVRKIGLQVSLIAINDARRIEKYFSPRINGLFKRRARKVVVSPLGEVTEAHD